MVLLALRWFFSFRRIASEGCSHGGRCLEDMVLYVGSGGCCLEDVVLLAQEVVVLRMWSCWLRRSLS